MMQQTLDKAKFNEINPFYITLKIQIYFHVIVQNFKKISGYSIKCAIILHNLY